MNGLEITPLPQPHIALLRQFNPAMNVLDQADCDHSFASAARSALSGGSASAMVSWRHVPLAGHSGGFASSSMVVLAHNAARLSAAGDATRGSSRYLRRSSWPESDAASPAALPELFNPPLP
jgi:hypothetical protein